MVQIVVGPKQPCQLPEFNSLSDRPFGPLFATLCQTAADVKWRIAFHSPHAERGWVIIMRHDLCPDIRINRRYLYQALARAFDKLAEHSPGQTLTIDYEDGFHVKSRNHRASLRIAANKRASTTYRHISVKGVVYPNLTRASAAVKLSPRALRRYALSDLPEHRLYFFVDEGSS